FITDGNVSENAGYGGHFNNSGTLAKTGGTGSSAFATFVRMNNLDGGSFRGDTGTLDLSALGTLSGRMDIAAGARIVAGTLVNTGIVAGSGTLDLGGALLTNRGVLQPGGVDAIGTLSVNGALQQEADGRIDAEFAGGGSGQYDVLSVSGAAVLDGDLDLHALGGALPSEGMQLDVVSSAISVSTGSLRLNAPSSGYSVQPSGNALRVSYGSCLTGICWDGGAGSSNWLDAANWTGDVLPGLNDLVFIDLAGGADVVLNANPTQTVLGLTIGNANSLTLTGGTLNAPTTVHSGGTLNLDGGTLNFGPALRNDGTVNYGGGSLVGDLLTNNGTLNIVPGSSGNLTTTRFDNRGNVIVDAGRTVELGTGGDMIFANDGNVEVRSGTLSISADDTDAAGPGADSGRYVVSSDATLRLRDANRDFGAGSSVSGAGDVEFTAASGGTFNVNGSYDISGTTRVSGNTQVNFNRTAHFGDLDVAGNIGGGGTLNVRNDLTWTAGTLSGAGRSIFVGGDTLLDGIDLNLNGARLNVSESGLIAAGTQVALAGNAQLVVAQGATLGLGNGSSVGGDGSVINNGTLAGTIGGGASTVGVRLINDGNVQASAGNLGLTGGIGGTGGFVIGADATMELGGDLPADIFDRIGGAGTLGFSSSSAPVINQSFNAQGGTPLGFSLRGGSVLSASPRNGSLSGAAQGWVYTANSGFNGNDSAHFSLSLGKGTATINILFAVTSPPPVTQPQIQVITTGLLPEVFQPPRMALPEVPVQAIVTPPIGNVASIDSISDIATASGPQFEQPLREFRASRLQCR
ncbi:MAG: hypothetical protein KKA92_01605, partial [Gammaproteobacteria bacterium]|nr:hypothetical protein [Gammaproteobacteria bacterium]